MYKFEKLEVGQLALEYIDLIYAIADLEQARFLGLALRFSN